MHSYSRKQVADSALFTDADYHLSQERGAKVEALADLAEIDARKLYLPAGYPSMYALCVERFRLTEQAAYKRIYAGRAARAFPAIFEALAAGRLSLSTVVMLGPKLTKANADELITAAENRTMDEVKRLLAHWFPALDEPTSVVPLTLSTEPAAPASAGGAAQLSARKVETPAPRAEVAPTAPDRYAVRFSIGQQDLELLERAKSQLSHRIPSGDEGQVFLHALRALVRRLETRKFGSSDRPRPSVSRESRNPRHIPAQVRRAVCERDGQRCTFVAANGHRCAARRLLEFDHIVPVARGGKSWADNLRLRCRAHNQVTAEETYGEHFMQAKREESQHAAARQRIEEVVPWLRALGIRADHAREAAARCDKPNATLEERVKAALSCFAPRDVQLRRATPI
jgi:5-methylcytosine-specific restriction endonuclease McrA